jgi:hypothetical protein
LPQIFHISGRTWIVMAYSGGLLFLASFVPGWMKSKIDPGARTMQAGFALGIYACGLALAMHLFRGVLDWKLLCSSCVIMLITLSAFVLAGDEKPFLKNIGLGLLLFIGTASALSLSASYLGKVNHEPYGERLMRAESEIMERVPSGAKNQYFYRVVADNAFPNLCLYLRCSSLESYPIRVLPDEVFRFFNELGAIKSASLPYFAHFDYERLSALGLVRMLGLKYWILASPPPSFLAGSAPKDLSTVAPIRYYELSGAFARAWPLQRWTTADSLEGCARRVAALGTAGALGKEGVLLIGERSPRGPDSPRSSVAAAADVEIIKSQPGRILCRTNNQKEVVLATNEIYNESWKATVDGKTETPLRVNCIFLGAAVAPGEHAVQFRQASAAAEDGPAAASPSGYLLR